MSRRTQLKLILLALLFATLQCFTAEVAHAETRPWYHTLRPGVTRAEIQSVSGLTLPSGSKVEIDAGASGRFEFEFRGDVLHRALHYNPALFPGGADQVYAAHSGPVPADPAARRSFLKAGKYEEIPRFNGPVIRTRKYSGTCYEVDGQYIVVAPIAEQGTGHFSRTPRRVLLVDAAGKEKILFHAKDRWEDLRPPNVSARAAAKREETLRRLGTRAIGTRIGDVLGQEDSQMGSGIDYRLYYLPSALAVVHVGGDREQVMPGRRPDFILRINLVSPGGEQHITFEEWLRASSSHR